MMSKKRSRMARPWSTELIRKAHKHLKQMPKEQMIDIMVEMGSLTPEQGERAKKKWAEIQAGLVPQSSQEGGGGDVLVSEGVHEESVRDPS
jgi:hypothetical protein